MSFYNPTSIEIKSLYLRIVCVANSPKEAKQLIESDLNLMRIDMFKYTYLHYACIYASLDVVKLLVNRMLKQ